MKKLRVKPGEKIRLRDSDPGDTSLAPGDKEEATHFVESLLTHGQIASESSVAPGDATHEISTDSEGRRYLVRKRFTAV